MTRRLPLLVALLIGVSPLSGGGGGFLHADSHIPPGCLATGTLFPPFAFVGYQPRYDETNAALGEAATGSLIDDEAFLAPLLETGHPEQILVAPFVPARLWRALVYIESAWHHDELWVERGGRGPVLVSSSCAYGITQQLSGMQHTTDDGSQPTRVQRLIGTDYRYNIARGVQELVEKWNYAPYYSETIAFPIVGDRQPKFAESWYYAVWSYHGMTTRNHPANPDMPWPRPRYNSPEYLSSGACRGYGCYPYQELVYDMAQYPPLVFGVRLWQPFTNTLPNRRLFVLPGSGRMIWPPPDIPLPEPAHQDRTREGAPVLEVGQSTVALDLLDGSRVPPVEVAVRNAGTGAMGWRASLVEVDAAEQEWVAAEQHGAIGDGKVLLTFDAAGLGPGFYRARLRIDAPLSPGSPRIIPIVLAIGQGRSFIPGLARN